MALLKGVKGFGMPWEEQYGFAFIALAKLLIEIGDEGSSAERCRPISHLRYGSRRHCRAALQTRPHAFCLVVSLKYQLGHSRRPM
jgi:hypothetical protein